MSDKYFVGLDVVSSSNNGKYKPVSRVTLMVDDSKAITAGDDTGYEIIADCPHATQAMVDSLLASFKGHEYQAYSAGDANIDPSAELGDGITVSGIYSVLSRMRDDGSGFPSVEAPGKAEDEDEYPIGGPMTQAFNRELAQARSLISKTSEEIRLEVSKKVGESEVKSLISTEVGKIRLSVSSANGSTTFTLTDQNATLSTQTLNLSVPAVNISGQLTADQINAKDLQVDAANVTGYLSANRLSLDGPMALTSGSSVYGYMGVNTTKGGPVLCDSTDSVFFVATPSAAKMSYHEEKMMWVHSGGCYTSETIQVYSDARLKNSINYDMSDVEKVFPLLRPCSFKMNVDGENAKTHWGFIAQDFIEAAEEAGLDPSSLAILGEYDGMHSIGYGEMPVVNTLMIQHLMSRVAALESKVEG